MRTGVIKAPQDLIGGLVIVAMALFALWLGSDLPRGTLRAIGPGMMPSSFAIILIILGSILVFVSFLERGDDLGTISVRGLVFVPVAIILFAYTVRPLGLAVAAPVAILLSSLASSESKWWEVILLSVVMSALCILLFKIALRLPIPLAPLWLGY